MGKAGQNDVYIPCSWCRAMVAVVFPFFMTVLVVMKAVMVFKRGKIPDKEVRVLRGTLIAGHRQAVTKVYPRLVSHSLPQKFNCWIDGEFEATPQTAIAVYPEGVCRLPVYIAVSMAEKQHWKKEHSIWVFLLPRSSQYHDRVTPPKEGHVALRLHPQDDGANCHLREQGVHTE